MARSLSAHIALDRNDKIQAGAASAACFILYAVCTARTVHVGDSPELATVVSTLGVAHPPGYALYTLVTAAWVRLLPFLEPAHAANLASALYAGLAVGLVWLLCRRLGLPPAAAYFSALCLALGRTFWSQAVVAEVYTMDALLLLAVLHAALSLGGEERGGRAWLVGSLLLGSWLLHRPSNLIYLPAVTLASMTGGQGLPRPRPTALAAGGLLALLPLLYLPLASAWDPYMDMGNPETWAGFWAVVTAAPFRGLLGGVTAGAALERGVMLVEGLPHEVGIAAPAALLGLAALFRWGRPGHYLLGTSLALMAAGTAFTLAYDILDYEAYLIPAYLGLCLLGGAGVRWIQLILPRGKTVVGAALALASMAALPFNFQRNDLSSQDLVDQAARDILTSLKQGALLLTQGDATSTAMGYLQAVEGRAPSISVVRIGNLSPWYLRQLAARSPAAPWPSPDSPPDVMKISRRILALQLPTRPIFVPLSVDPRQILPRDGSLGLVPRGLVREVRQRGERIPLRRLAREDARRLLASAARLSAPGEDVDMDLRSVYLSYAFALVNTAEILARFKDRKQALSCLDAVLDMDPEGQERAMEREMRRKGDQRIPRLNLEEKTRRLMALLKGEGDHAP